jgi:hypothetical protein
MFNKTMNLTDLKRNINDVLGELDGDDAIQVVHRGKPIKVVITQEHYLKLLGLVNQLDSRALHDEDLVSGHSVDDRKKRLRKKLKKVDDGEKTTRSLVDDRSVGTP